MTVKSGTTPTPLIERREAPGYANFRAQESGLQFRGTLATRLFSTVELARAVR